MENIEKKIIAFIKTQVTSDWVVATDRPSTMPNQLITVERTGGPVDSVRIERPAIIVSVYHKTSAVTASDMALQIDDRLRNVFIQDPTISKVERNSLVRLDDLVAKIPRYQIYFSIVHLS